MQVYTNRFEVVNVTVWCWRHPINEGP